MDIACIEEWKRYGTRIDVIIVGDEKREPAEVFIQTWTKSQRRWRAVKSLGFWWGIALLSIFIPIIHFLSVPLFLLTGMTAPFFVHNRRSIVLGGRGTCPFCSKPFDIVKCANIWPLHDVCASCKRHVQIEKS